MTKCVSSSSSLDKVHYVKIDFEILKNISFKIVDCEICVFVIPHFYKVQFVKIEFDKSENTHSPGVDFEI